MIDLALTPAERDAFEETLGLSHRIRIGLKVHDQDEREIDNLHGKVVSGAVQIDASADVSRALSLTLLDEERDLRFEPDSPADGALYVDRFLSATYGVYVDSREQWVDVPVFFGPITLVERSGAEVKVEAQGKERLMLAPHLAGQGYTIRKGTHVDEAIRSAARRDGETKFNLPEIGIRLPRSRGVLPTSETWKVIKGGEETAKGAAIPGLIERAGGDMTPYFNGRGELCARQRDTPTVFTFKGGEESLLLDEPTYRYDVAEFRNTVILKGGRKAKKARASARVSLPAAHPLSPRSLARNGEPRYMIEFAEVDVKTDAKAKRRAEQLLARLSKEGVGASFNCLPVPHLEENDVVTLRTSEFAVTFPVQQMTIPLTPTDSMAIGATKQVRR